MLLHPPSHTHSLVAATHAVPSDSASRSRNSLPLSHPISHKVRTILARSSSSYEDQLAREALEALEDLYPITSSSSRDANQSNRQQQEQHRGRHRRKRTAGRGSLDTPADAAAREDQVDIEKAKANLQNDAHLALMKSSDDFLEILREVDQAIDDVASNIHQMARACDEIDTRVTRTNDATRWFLEQAEGLQRQETTTSQQALLLDFFLRRFTLRAEELEAITHRDVLVGKSLFDAMDRLDQIRTDCRGLLEGGGEIGGGTRAGTDVMATTSSQLDMAYEKIGRYLSFEFRQSPKEGLDVSQTLREAVQRTMNGREDLLKTSLQILSSIRSSHLSSSFLQALTRGSPTSNSRPIELYAHDPQRYIGDMLAWVHQAVASEREFLGQLLGETDGEDGRKTGERRRGIEGSIDWSSHSAGADKAWPQGKKSIYIRELLDRCLEGCCRPLQIRIEQTTRSQEGCIVPFKLANLVQFYKVTMQRTIGSKVSLTRTLEEISTSSYQAFLAALERQGRGLLRFIQAPEANLTPPASLVGAIDTLQEILSVHQMSISESMTTASLTSISGESKTRLNDEISSTIADFDQVLQRLVDPMLELVKKTEEVTLGESIRVKGPEEKDQARKAALVLRVNSINGILTVVSRFDFVPSTVQRLRKLIDETADELAAVDYEEMLLESGLQPIIEAMNTKNEATPLAHHPSTSPSRVQSHLSTFSTFLSSPSLLSPTLFSHLSSPSLRTRIHLEALTRLAQGYERVYDAIKDERNKFEWRETVLRRSKEEVRMLLGVE